ncbi:MAG: energy transducer TonB [Deltaproteobacteria bacterium]|nr:energy transducer TonB [Deltaproteobacteria bacterium]
MNSEHQPIIGNHSMRLLVAVAGGAVTAFALFWIMQALVTVKGELKDSGTNLTVDFVRLKRDTTPEIKKREAPKRQKPEQQPPPPEMNLAKNMNPSDAVGDIIPDLDTGLELEDATNIDAAGGGDREAVPLFRVEPNYPPRAKQQGIEGYVDLRFTITPVGTTGDVEVFRSKPAYIFDREAIRAVRKWRYNPKLENGVPISRPNQLIRLLFELPKEGRR